MTEDLDISEASDDDAPAGLIALNEADRNRLSDALQELLAHGSITGLDAGRSELYHWCRRYFEWLKEAAALVGLDIAIHHDERIVQAIPRTTALQLRLKQDATLVWLALWYAGDIRWRDEGQTQAFLSVAELNGLLKDQLLPDATGLLSPTRLNQILRQAARFHLIRFESAEPFEESGIEILPAIRRIVPFRDLTAWSESADAFRDDSDQPEPDEDDA